MYDFCINIAVVFVGLVYLRCLGESNKRRYLAILNGRIMKSASVKLAVLTDKDMVNNKQKTCLEREIENHNNRIMDWSYNK